MIKAAFNAITPHGRIAVAVMDRLLPLLSEKEAEEVAEALREMAEACDNSVSLAETNHIHYEDHERLLAAEVSSRRELEDFLTDEGYERACPLPDTCACNRWRKAR